MSKYRLTARAIARPVALAARQVSTIARGYGRAPGDRGIGSPKNSAARGLDLFGPAPTIVRIMPATDEVVVRNGRVLLGFMIEPEAQAFVASQVKGEWSQWRPKWTTAATAVAARTPPPYAAPEIRDLEGDERKAADSIEALPIFKQQQAQRHAEIRAVEIDKLVVFQQFVDSQFSLGNGGDTPKGAALIQKCFPLNMNERVGVNVDGDGAVSITSLTRNIYWGPPRVKPEADGVNYVSFPIVLSPNWVSVAEVGGRYYLQNGYHRTWLLRHQGVTHVPAMVLHFGSWAEMALGPGFFGAGLVTSDRAPLFCDFFDDKLAIEMTLKSTLTVLRATAQRSVLSRLP